MSQIFRAKERLLSKTRSIAQRQEQEQKKGPKKFTLSSISQHLDKSQAQIFSPLHHRDRRLTMGNQNVVSSPTCRSQHIYRRVSAYNIPNAMRENFNESSFEQPIQSNEKPNLLYKNEIPLMISILPRRFDNSPIKPRQCSRPIAETFLKDNLSSSRGFIDQIFPPVKSIIFSRKNDFYKFQISQSLSFERGSKISTTAQLLRTYEPTLLHAGKFTNPLLYCAMTILCQDPPRLLSLFGNQQLNEQGIYYVNLCNNGVWKFIFVDDFLPFGTNRRKKNLLGITGPELWCSILEKAVAKIYGSYFDLYNSISEGITPFFKLLSGLPATLYYLNKDFRSYVLLIDAALKKNHIVILEGLSQNQILNVDYCYKLIQLKKGSITVRNLQTSSLTTKLTFEQALMFSRLLIFRCQKDYVHHTQKLRHKKKYFSSIKLTVQNTTKCYWQINQCNLSLYKPYLHIEPLRFTNPSRIIIRSEEYSTECEIGKQIQLKEGNYVIFVHLCQEIEQDFTLVYYGQNQIKMQRIKNMNKWDEECQCNEDKQ